VGDEQADRYQTLRTLRDVLIVLRNLTTLSRLRDVMPAIADTRIRVRITIDEGSSAVGGFLEQVRYAGFNPIPWSEACEIEHDLIIAAHVNASLASLRGPIFCIAHGRAYGRRVAFRTGDHSSPVGLSNGELVAQGVVIPAIIGLADDCQLRQLEETCPAALPRAHTIGDPTFEVIQYNTQSSRMELRASLEIPEDVKVVLLSSTWGPHSLLAHHPDLPNKMVAQLPADRYKVVLILHPNVWAMHQPGVLIGQYRRALAAGMIIIRPCADWHVGPVIADLVIGDHGSVAGYGAANGVPFLAAGSGSDELVDDPAVGRYTEIAARINGEGDLRSQIEQAIAEGARSDVTEAARVTLGRCDHSLERFRQKVYEVLDLPLPDEQLPPRALDRLELVPPGQPTRAFHIVSEIVEGPLHCPAVRVERFPFALARDDAAVDGVEHVLVADFTQLNLRRNAEVLVQARLTNEHTARAWAAATLTEYGCSLAIAATDLGYFAQHADGAIWRVTVVPVGRAIPQNAQVFLVAGAMHRWMVYAGTQANAYRLTVNVESASLVLDIRRLACV
jgi:hypothetical protein